MRGAGPVERTEAGAGVGQGPPRSLSFARSPATDRPDSARGVLAPVADRHRPGPERAVTRRTRIRCQGVTESVYRGVTNSVANSRRLSHDGFP